MVTPKSTASPDASTYRLDVAPGEHGSVYHVIRCETVARFDNEAHAAFLVELLAKGQLVDAPAIANAVEAP
jgi:hypothetical protein